MKSQLSLFFNDPFSFKPVSNDATTRKRLEATKIINNTLENNRKNKQHAIVPRVVEHPKKHVVAIAYV